MDPSQYPALYDSPLGIKTAVICFVFEVLAIIAVALRLWARFMKKKPLAFNDYAVLVALLLTSALVSIILMSVFWAGTGHHMKDIYPLYQSRIFVMFAAGQPLWGAANTFIKLSILHLYITIFPNHIFQKFCYGTMVLSVCYFISVFLETFLLCTPVQFNWDKTIAGTCANAETAYIVAGSTNLVIDVLIVVLPMPMLWQLQIPWARKAGIVFMFSLGAVICIITLLRVIYIVRMDLNDFSFAAADLSVWSILEPTLGVVNASLPVLRPILTLMFKSRPVQWARSSFSGFTKRTPSSKSSGSFLSTLSGSKKSDPKRFQRLDDTVDRLYPLDTVKDHTQIESRVDRNEGTHRLHEGEEGDIRVTQSWNVA